MFRKIRVFFFLALLAVAALSAKKVFLTEKTPSRECENLFASSLYDAYHLKLKSHLQRQPGYETVKEGTTELDRQMQQLLAAIDKPLGDSPTEKRAFHEAFVGELRKAAAQANAPVTEKELPAQQLFQSTIRWLFLEASLGGEVTVFLQDQILPRDPGKPIFDYLVDAQEELHDRLKAKRQKVKGTPPEDHFLSGNLPLLISSIPTRNEPQGLNALPSAVDSQKVNKPVQLIRIAQPLLAPSFFVRLISSAVPAPEFVQFLQQQESHLYVNLMRRQGSEGKLSTALELLQESIPHLHVVTLDKDSDFYWQRGKYETELIDSDAFTKMFIDEMSYPGGRFFWSQDLEEKEWLTALKGAVESTRQEHFGRQLSLSRGERLDFIELTYLKILDALVSALQPVSMNITCRQSMDRGPSLMSLWLWKQGRLDEETLTTLLLAPPLIVHQRTCHLSRLKRFISAAERLGSVQ